MKKNFFVSTPIYYVNGDPHVGSAYTTIAADVINRYNKAMGMDTHFVTGLDEHGQKVEQAAEQHGFTPQAWTDKMTPNFKNMWAALNIKYDDFIRTTEERHKKAVKKILEIVHEKGDIYKGEYEGKYCVSCETFFPENQLNGSNKCPDCGKELTVLKEESYFFKMSKYADALLKHIDEHPDFILPHSRRNEVISFIKQGLQDLSISRNTFTWGIPIEFAPGHITYVWFDALTNYITSAGFENDDKKFDKFWKDLEVHRNNPFNLVATIAAYTEGEEYLVQLKKYLEDNIMFVYNYCKDNIPQIKPNIPQATYLVWVDCRQLCKDFGFNQADLEEFMLKKAKLGLNPGRSFQKDLEGFMRINTACPRSVLEKALKQLENAVKELSK